MNPEQFREHAHQLVDWMADYLSQVQDYPVTPATQPGDVLRLLPTQMPNQGEPFDALFADFESQILPHMTHWQHPGFMGYFPANASPVSVLGEMLTATLGAQCMSWLTSPAATELEQRVLEWLQTAMQLPAEWSGVIQDTASTATLTALLTAREQASGQNSGQTINQAGFQGQRYRVYASEQAHSSVDKAVRIAGIGSQHLVKIPVDEHFAMRPDALAQAITQDREAGFRPLCVIAAWGTTGSTALDPLAAIGQICQQEQIWLHVDAAYAGSAFLLPEHRELALGLELADSMVFNPHKWLLTHFDCSAYFVKDASLLTQSFGLTPEYLKTRQDQEVNNYRDWGVQLGRRFRALKLWFVLRYYGLNGLRSFLREQISWSQELAQQIDDHAQFERLAPTPLNLVCFRWHQAGMSESDLNARNAELMQTLNAGGKFFLTHTLLNGKYSLRLVAGQRTTRRKDVQAAWAEIQRIARELS